jgi:hypothetical protein
MFIHKDGRVGNHISLRQVTVDIMQTSSIVFVHCQRAPYMPRVVMLQYHGGQLKKKSALLSFADF